MDNYSRFQDALRKLEKARQAIIDEYPEQLPDERLIKVADRMRVPVMFQSGPINAGDGRIAEGITDVNFCDDPRSLHVERIIINTRPALPIDFLLAHELGHALDAKTTPDFWFMLRKAVSLYGYTPGSPGAQLALLGEERAWKLAEKILRSVSFCFDPTELARVVESSLAAHKVSAAKVVR